MITKLEPRLSSEEISGLEPALAGRVFARWQHKYLAVGITGDLANWHAVKVEPSGDPERPNVSLSFKDDVSAFIPARWIDARFPMSVNEIVGCKFAPVRKLYRARPLVHIYWNYHYSEDKRFKPRIMFQIKALYAKRVPPPNRRGNPKPMLDVTLVFNTTSRGGEEAVTVRNFEQDFTGAMFDALGLALERFEKRRRWYLDHGYDDAAWPRGAGVIRREFSETGDILSSRARVTKRTQELGRISL
jgi:hypothetical protein